MTDVQHSYNGNGCAAPACCHLPHTVWLGAFGEYAREHAQSQTPEFQAGIGGAILGFDWNGQDANTVGVGAAYSFTHIHEDDSAGRANVNQGYLTAYGSWNPGSWYFDFGLWGGYYHFNNDRRISFPGFSGIANSDTHGWQFTPHFEFGYNDFSFCNPCYQWFVVEPFAMADWVNCWESALQEHGGGSLNMGQKGRYCSLLRAEGGVRLYERLQLSSGQLILTEKGSYAYQKAFHTGHLTAFLVGSPGSFTVSTLTGAQNLGVGEFSLLYIPCDPRAPYFNISYQGEFGSKYQSHQGLLTVGKDF